MHIERQILPILALKRHVAREDKPCWLVRDCPEERKRGCPAWQIEAGCATGVVLNQNGSFYLLCSEPHDTPEPRSQMRL